MLCFLNGSSLFPCIAVQESTVYANSLVYPANLKLQKSLDFLQGRQKGLRLLLAKVIAHLSLKSLMMQEDILSKDSSEVFQRSSTLLCTLNLNIKLSVV